MSLCLARRVLPALRSCQQPRTAAFSAVVITALLGHPAIAVLPRGSNLRSNLSKFQSYSSNMAHTTFPADLPVPEDDGAAKHLSDITLISMALPATSGSEVDVSSLSGLTILFCYPRTGAPGETVPESWNSIPGARGCTPQACSFRDLSKEFLQLGVSHIFGLSTQDTTYQKEVEERLHLPFQLLSDEKLEFTKALNLPTFAWEDKTVLKRLTMAIEDGKVVKVWYPVFPPDKNAAEVMQWLSKEYRGRKALDA